jgi:ribonuclease BN (tRNA processing enzyme)
MGQVDVRFVGSGDAFGSGGRFQTCIALRTSDDLFLVDCGASSLIAMRQQKIEPRDVSKILITHLHGDHFGGLPFFLLDAQLVSHRTAPLTLVGPPGFEARLMEAMEILFTGSSKVDPNFELRFVELKPRTPTAVDEIEVTAFPAAHFSGAPSYSLRVKVEGKVFVYSGDSQWTDTLADYPHTHERRRSVEGLRGRAADGRGRVTGHVVNEPRALDVAGGGTAAF